MRTRTAPIRSPVFWCSASATCRSSSVMRPAWIRHSPIFFRKPPWVLSGPCPPELSRSTVAALVSDLRCSFYRSAARGVVQSCADGEGAFSNGHGAILERPLLFFLFVLFFQLGDDVRVRE